MLIPTSLLEDLADFAGAEGSLAPQKVGPQSGVDPRGLRPHSPSSTPAGAPVFGVDQ